MIQDTRIKVLNTEKLKKKDYVLYWMQASQRAEYNHALEFALREANSRSEPLLVYFGITDKYPEANQRHYNFMLQGLKETQADRVNRQQFLQQTFHGTLDGGSGQRVARHLLKLANTYRRCRR